MKIVHVCKQYTDGLSYQENNLAVAHKLLGHDVTVITSCKVWNKKGKLILYKSGEYFDSNGVKIIRQSFKFSFFKNIQYKLEMFRGLRNNLQKERPDIIFKHNCEGMTLNTILSYKRENKNVRVFIDNHVDLSNLSKKWYVVKFLYRGLWRYYINHLIPYTEKFYGVLTARVETLQSIFGVPKEKIELLIMGANDRYISEARNDAERKRIRDKYHIGENDILIVTGGKIDREKKQVLLLIKAIKKMDKHIKLIIFGSIEDFFKEEMRLLIDGIKVQFIGWLEAKDIYKFLYAADLAVFPGRHSVIWEETVGLGIPAVFKYWEGITHIDIGGNCKFIYQDTVEEIIKVLRQVVENPKVYKRMERISREKGIKIFSYINIAKRSIEFKI